MSKDFTIYIAVPDEVDSTEDIMNYLSEFECFEFSEDNARRAAKMYMRDDCSDTCVIVPLEVKVDNAKLLTTTITEAQLNLE